MKNEVKKFEVGKTYYRIANDDSAAGKVLYKVTKRTEKAATFEDVDGAVFKKKIYADMGEAEAVMIGKTQIISASDVADEEAAQKVIPVENETDGSEDDAEENVATDYNFDVEESDDELIDTPEMVKYNLISYSVNGQFKFNGKRINKQDAAREIKKAAGIFYQFKFNPYEIESNVLFVDKAAISRFEFNDLLYNKRLSRWLRIVDLGRDYIPTINQKTENIIAIRRDMAKAQDEENARIAAYLKSPEYKLEQIEKEIRHIDAYLEYNRYTVKTISKAILEVYIRLADLEDRMLERTVEVIDTQKDREKFMAQAKRVSDEIATRNAHAAINAAAVGMVDDGTNEEDAEEMTIDYNFDVEEEDDELVDPPIEYHIVEVPAAVELVTFEVERFGEDSDNAAMREELEDEINCKLAAIAGLEKEVAELREKLKAIAPVDEDERIFELELRYCDLQTEMGDIDAEIEDYLNTAVSEVEEICQKVVKNKITLVTYDGKRYEINPKKKVTRMHVCHYVDAEAKLRIYVNCDEVEGYGKIADFKSIMKDLEAAIERGDKEFTFPRGDR